MGPGDRLIRISSEANNPYGIIRRFMIQVDSLTKDYAGRRGIRDVTFTVEKGEILGFLGPNGAGKTTTMRILTGYLPPTSGHASIAGFDVSSESLEARRHIGYLPETVPLYKELTVLEYLTFVTRLRDIPKAQRAEKIDMAMEKTNITDVADVFIGKLSKGYRQRVGLAQAVVHEPDVMILDEPTEGLDPRQRTETRALIRDLAKAHTIILSTHILPEVEAVCDRVLIIDRGRIVAEGTPSDLRAKLAGAPVVHVVVKGAVSVREDLSALPGVASVELEDAPGETRARVLCVQGSDPREEIFRLAVERGWVLRELARAAMTLEDVFVRLTRHDEGSGEAGAAGGSSQAPS